MFCVLESLQPATSVCARAGAAPAIHSSRTQTIRMRMRRTMNFGGDDRGRQSAKNITQRPYEKDGTGRDNRSSGRERSVKRPIDVRLNLDRWDESPDRIGELGC